MDSEFWKKLHSGMWKDGIHRSQIVGELIQSFGYEIRDNGFLSNSIEYSKESPAERGIPDLMITKNGISVCFLEITGTVKMVGTDIWIRPDKFEYAEKHPEIDCWVGHIEESSKTIRFIKLENKNGFSTIQPKIRGITETYKAIPITSSAIISPIDFRNYLDRKST